MRLDQFYNFCYTIYMNQKNIIKNIIIIVLAFALTVLSIDDINQHNAVNDLNDYITNIGE